ncbi:hypothetical protein CBS101457_000702 [Exobasidium rhododendri]|nr:hypothetical protein CBS101457_000702 [Exobasidium rhododendri]
MYKTVFTLSLPNSRRIRLLYDAGSKLELLLSFCARRSHCEEGPSTEWEESMALDELDEQLRQFGKVIWSLGETDSLLDESSTASDAATTATAPIVTNETSPGDPFESTQQRTEWERVWQDFFGSLDFAEG